MCRGLFSFPFLAVYLFVVAVAVLYQLCLRLYAGIFFLLTLAVLYPTAGGGNPVLFLLWIPRAVFRTLYVLLYGRRSPHSSRPIAMVLALGQ